MALVGVHVACTYIGGLDVKNQQTYLMGQCVWSETLPNPGTTVSSAPPHLNLSDPSFTINASLDVFVAVGSAPDASKSPRMFVPAGTDGGFSFFVKPGDKLAWIAA